MRLNISALWLMPALILTILITIISSCADKTNPVTTPSGPTLTLSLDTTLDGTGEILADSISSAALADTAGTVLKTAQITSNNTTFDLAGIGAGDYFITVNGQTQARVPARIIAYGDTVPDVMQFVNKQLNASLIVVDNDTLFRIKSFFRGQREHPVRQFSDGANVSPEEYAYAIESFGMMNRALEIRVDSTAELLVRQIAPRHNPHPFGTWMLGDSNHGIGPAGDPDSTSAQCQSCHADFDTKPADWHEITAMNGYCFKCHYGSGGVAAGITDPAK